MKLVNLLPLKEGKHKKEERVLKNRGKPYDIQVKIDFSEALESLESDGVLESNGTFRKVVLKEFKMYIRC